VGCYVVSDREDVPVTPEAPAGMSAATLMRGIGYASIAGFTCGVVAAIAALLGSAL
jgi:hypothetical protein